MLGGSAVLGAAPVLTMAAPGAGASVFHLPELVMLELGGDSGWGCR